VSAVFAGAGWRGAYIAGALAAAVALAARAMTRTRASVGAAGAADLGQAIRAALRSLSRGEVLRSLVLLEVADIMLDVLTGYLALYFVDVLGEPAWVGALVVGVRVASGLAGDFLSVHVLERFNGLAYVHTTVAGALLAYPAFLVIPGVAPKVALLAPLSVLTAGWYPVLQARLYRALPGQSGAQLAVGNVFRFAASPIPFLIGLAAARFGLGAALWLFAASPVLLALLLPPRDRQETA